MGRGAVQKARECVIGQPVILGREPLSKVAFEELQTEAERNRLSDEDWVRRVINNLLQAGRGSYDCNFLHLHIGYFKSEVVERVLPEYVDAGWSRAYIDSASEQYGITIVLI